MARGRKSPLVIELSPMSDRLCNAGSARPRRRQTWPAGDALSCCWLSGTHNPMWRRWPTSNGVSCASRLCGFSPSGLRGCMTPLAEGPRAFFPPEVAIHMVRLTCERPDILGRSLSQ
jgi:hypothetical protein